MEFKAGDFLTFDHPACKNVIFLVVHASILMKHKLREHQEISVISSDSIELIRYDVNTFWKLFSRLK